MEIRYYKHYSSNLNRDMEFKVYTEGTCKCRYAERHHKRIHTGLDKHGSYYGGKTPESRTP